MATNTQPALPAQWTLQSFLKFFLIIFDAALRAFPDFAIKGVFQLTDGQIWEHCGRKVEFPVFYFETDRNKDRVLSNPLPEELESHWHFLQYYLHCENFVLTLLKPLSEKAQEIFGAKVHWLLTKPLLNAQYVESMGLKEIDDIKHSVLEITLPDGSVWIFDGTGRQFWWANKDWFMVEADFWSTYAKDDFCAYLGEEEMEENRNEGQGDTAAFWEIVGERVVELVHGLDCNALPGMEVEEREELVKKQAEQTFADAFATAESVAGA